MAYIRMFVYDGTYYQTGVLNTDAKTGQQCLQPDPQSFTSMEQMINYAAAKGESIQQVTVAQVNALCSGQQSFGTIQNGASCCLCQGGGAKNFVPGAGNVPPDPSGGVMPSNPVIELPTTVAGRIIAQARKKPVNTIVF